MSKIIEFRAQNFARLSAVAIRPDGAIVQITGKNQQGKTSVLNGIWTALKGRTVAPVQPIHTGAEEARLQVDIGTMIITRTFKRTKNDEITSDLKVTMADGTRVGTKPQQMIDALLGDLSFNPLEFSRLPAKEQFERVKRFVPGFDFERNAAGRKYAFEGRTEANRRAKDARARANGINLPPGPKPVAPDTVEATSKLRDAFQHNNKRQIAIQRRMDKERQRDRLLNESADLISKANDLRLAAEEITEELSLVSIPDAIDTDKLASIVASADGIRAIRDKFDQRGRFEQEVEASVREADTLTETIDQCDAAKQKAIAAAKMPVDGLAFGDEEVLLNGLPFSQAGTAEKLRASIGIAMALNPDLKVMLVDEGSELDSTSLAIVADLAEKHDYQVWMARVDESGKVGFVIEDGILAQ